MDAALNLIWPGLGQLNQGRTRPAAYFALEAAVLVALFAALPLSRAILGVLIAGLTLWSMIDAVTGRRAS
jgi:hypothetical protein